MTARAAAPFSPQALAEALAELGCADRLVVALSGGADSAALLAAASGLRPRYAIRAVHVDHGFPASPLLRDAAQAAARHCGVTLQTIEVTVTEVDALGLEAAARSARYRALQHSLMAGEDLLTAHHAEDQAETVLLQLLRGAGVRGLAAMPAVAPLGPGRLMRPLLGQSRAALRAFAQAAAIPWQEDPSNADLGLDRNYLRQVVWPTLLDRWPSAADTLSRATQHLADTLQLLDTALVPRLAAVETPSGLRLDGLREMEPSWRREVVRAWLRSQGLTVPSTRQLAQFDAQFLESGPDAQPALSLDGAELRRHDGLLVLQRPLPPLQLPTDALLPPQGVVPLPGLGSLRVTPGGEGALRCLSGSAYRLAPRQGGERWRPTGGMTRPLKDGLREARVPVWVRDRAVLLWDGAELAAVVLPQVTWIAGDYRAGSHEEGLEVHWEDAPAGLC